MQTRINKGVKQKRNSSKCSSDFSIEFSKRLKALRENRGLTQEEIAARMYINCRTYQNYEAGTVPGLEKIVKLATVLDCDTTYLTGENEDGVFRRDLGNVCDVTGLSYQAVEAIKMLKSDYDNLDLFFNNGLETLNFILEAIREKQEQSGIGFVGGLLHYIGLYLDSSMIKKESAKTIRYKYGNKWETLSTGDSVNGKTVEALDVLGDKTGTSINKPDTITIYDPLEDQHHRQSFRGLTEAYYKDKIFECLVDLRRRKEAETRQQDSQK